MDPGEVPDRIAGLRAVRIIASGERARLVLLQHPDGVLARLWHAHVPRVEIDRELCAMTRAEHPHLLRPLDAETLEDGRVVALVPRIGRGSVPRLIEGRDAISYGEAVTLGAPIASAVDALHAGGARHGAIASTRVLLTDAGAPVLVGFGRAAVFDRGLAAAARSPSIGTDPEDLRRYLLLLLGRVDPGDTRAARARSALQEVPDVDLPSVAARVLFENGGAAPVVFSDARVRATTPGNGRIGAPIGPSSVPAPSTPAIALGLPGLVGLLDRGSAGLGRAVRDRWAAVPRVRRLVVLAGGAAVAAALCAAVLVPGGTPEPRGERTPAASSPAATASAPAARSAPPGHDPAESAVRGTDPLAAGAVLLPARESCIRDADEGCLAAIDETGSALLDADRAAMNGQGRPILPEAPYSLIQALGDAALVSSPGARILLVRTPGGWRIREVSSSADVPPG